MSLIVMSFIIGIVLMGIGLLVWKKERIELLHQYHYRNVQDRKGYTTAMGKTILFMGGLIVLSGFLGLLSFIPPWLSTMVLYIGIGGSVVAILVIQNKYNGSVFGGKK